MPAFPPFFRTAPTIACVLWLTTHAACAADDRFSLGEVRVSTSRPQDPLNPAATTISSEDMQRFNRDTVGQALNLLPGVSVSNNMRNEQTISVRGFDGRRTPLFLDGIPVYVPYDGQVDFGRFLTFDLSEIEVSKGFSSIALDANTMGGAINLVTRKPQTTLEARGQAGIASGGGRTLSAQLGTNQGPWYLQASMATASADSYPLPHNFTPTALEDGGRRNNADRHDQQISLKIGLTPGGSDEYALAIRQQRGEKGQPPNTHPAATPLNFWRWPQYDKDSLYFIADKGLGATERLKVRLFHDTYAYQLSCFTNDRYSVGRNCQFGTPAAPQFLLDDTVEGGSVVLESTRFTGHVVRLAYHLKTDTHDEHTTGPTTTYRDRTRSFGIEDTVHLSDRFDLALSLGRDSATALTAGNYGNPADQAATQAQAGLFYRAENDLQLYTTLARKTRFPSIRERFSQQVGTQGGMLPGIANPDLRAETARHLELGAKKRYQAWAFEGALFRSLIDDSIQSVTFQSGGRMVGQLRNAGQAVSEGAELSARYSAAGLEAGGSLTHLERRNRDTPAVPATDTPRNKLFAFADYALAPGWRTVAALEAENGRTVATATNRSVYMQAGSFALLHLKLVASLAQGLALEFGANNATDRRVVLMDGLPQAGRTLFANLQFRL